MIKFVVAFIVMAAAFNANAGLKDKKLMKKINASAAALKGTCQFSKVSVDHGSFNKALPDFADRQSSQFRYEDLKTCFETACADSDILGELKGKALAIKSNSKDDKKFKLTVGKQVSVSMHYLQSIGSNDCKEAVMNAE